MSEPTKKQNFLHGAALLAGAAAIVKVLGALYKIPLNAIIGAQGFGYFNTAYQIYSVLLLISTAGLPVAVSRMISAASSLGHYNEVRRIHNTARAIFLSLGLVSSLLMVLCCHGLSNYMKQPDAWAAIATLGPCAFLVCLLSTYRGFFQGQGNMIPTSVNEIIEAVCKLVVGIVAALIILKATNSVALAAAGAILGVTLGCLMGAVYLSSCFHKAYRRMPVTNEAVSSYGSIVKELLAIAVPITIGSAGLQALYLIETNLFMGQLLATGNTQEQADTMKGIYDMTLTIYNMPCAFIMPITVSIIPAITSQLTLKNHKGVVETEESAARVTGLLALPCAAGIFVLAEPITALIGGYSGAELDISTPSMAVLGIGFFFYAVVQVTNALLQAHGHATLPVIHIMLAGTMKLAIVYILSGNPNIGIVGVGIGSALCNVCVCVLNLIAMRRVIEQRPAIVKNILRALPSTLIMGVAVFAVWKLLGMALAPESTIGRLLLCAIPVIAGVAVYAVCAVKLKAITREDCLLLPKGEKIAKLLHL